LARDFPLDWQEFEEDAATRRFAALREAAADPLFAATLPPEQLARIAEQQPGFCRSVHRHARGLSARGAAAGDR
jgi:hypothetical protein